MTKEYVLRAFQQAGYPMKPQNYSWTEYRYDSVQTTPVWIKYNPGHADLPAIRVRARGLLGEFDSPTKALRFIRGRLAMTYVPGNDFALNSGRKGQLRLVA